MDRIKKSFLITVTGIVQGVGFRPFVYRLAGKYHLAGWVMNTNENVQIKVHGTSNNIDRFLVSLKNEAPSASRIENISTEQTIPDDSVSFTILKSHNISDDITGISPDIAVCEDCLEDMEIGRAS